MGLRVVEAWLEVEEALWCRPGVLRRLRTHSMVAMEGTDTRDFRLGTPKGEDMY